MTIRAERVVLVVLRNIATVTWLLEILSELLPDRRIQVVFTLEDDGSAFADGVLEALRETGGRVIPWDQAIDTEFDLAIAASHNGGLERLRSPLLLTSHGIGFGKTKTVPDDGVPPLPRISGAHRRRTTVALSHPEQEGQWAAPDGEFATAVVGDPWMDRLEASRRRRRDYRAALGAEDHHRVVVLSSTWRTRSLLAEGPDLAARLLAELPADEYRVAAIIHPNVWSGHGSWQVRTWLREAGEGGLRLLPPRGGWRGALIAADCLIGDHGSVTFYAAALGVPVLLGAWGQEEMLPGTPLAEFGVRAPRLHPDEGLRGQLEAVGRTWDPGRYRDLAERCFAEPGRAMGRLREVIYELIDLEAPARPTRVTPVATPRPFLEAVTAHLVLARLEAGRRDGRILLERFPAHLRVLPDEEVVHSHLVVDDQETDERLRQSADVIVRRPEDGRGDEARAWAAATLSSYPGSQIAAAAVAGDLVAVAARGAGLRLLRPETPIEDPVGLVASAVRAHTALGRVVDGQALETRLGEATLRVLPVEG
ncbi:MAG TPA: hypothetical protein VHA80_12425 [Solirubrobacterales bacterium]|nr:hypothetical protein [Solirubrobacterales bacterium]